MRKLDRDIYITRQEYLKVIDEENPSSVLKNLDKEFSVRILGVIGSRLNLTDIVEKLDEYHFEKLLEFTKQCSDCGELPLVINGVFESYNVTLGLLEYRPGLKPRSLYLTTGIRDLEKILENRFVKYTNPYTSILVKSFLVDKRLRKNTVEWVFDSLKWGIVKNSLKYNWLIVNGVFYDLVLLRMCTISVLEDLVLRPLLISSTEYTYACKVLKTDIHAGLEYLERTRPVMNILVDIAETMIDLISGVELLDFLLHVTPSYLSNIVLYGNRVEYFMKNYYSLLRQLILLRFLFTSLYTGDYVLRDRLRKFIEKWVYP